jgi:hypothetical protein
VLELLGGTRIDGHELEAHDVTIGVFTGPHVSHTSLKHGVVSLGFETDAMDRIDAQGPGGFDECTAHADIAKTERLLSGDGPSQPTDNFEAESRSPIRHALTAPSRASKVVVNCKGVATESGGDAGCIIADL